jgi:hypothetical protein
VVDEFLGLNDVVGGNNGGEDVPVLLDPLPLVCDRRGAREGTLHGKSSSSLGSVFFFFFFKGRKPKP